MAQIYDPFNNPIKTKIKFKRKKFVIKKKNYNDLNENQSEDENDM